MALIEGDLKVEYKAGLILLIPSTKPAADALRTLIKEHPETPLTVETGEDNEKDKLTLQGIEVTKFVTGTKRVFVMDPVAE